MAPDRYLTTGSEGGERGGWEERLTNFTSNSYNLSGKITVIMDKFKKSPQLGGGGRILFTAGEYSSFLSACRSVV